MPKNKLRVEPNERIDIQDFQYLLNEGIHDNTEQLLEHLACSTTRTKKWILNGFTMSNPSAKQLQVTKGKAILAERRDGAVRYGMLVTEGDATKTIDLNTYSAGDYGIYIRFEPVAGDTASRIFWNPAGDGSEYASSIQTRYLANWSLRVEAASPGAEWLRIGEVAQATMDITDEREFYFEGSLPDDYESGWSADGGGVANDRNADRATYGVTDFQMAFAATRQCLEDIKGRGLRKWYERDIGGMNIGFDANPVEGKLAIGDAYFNFELNSAKPRFNLDDSDYLEYDRSTNTLKFTFIGIDAFAFSADTFAPLYVYSYLGASDKRWGEGYFYNLDVRLGEGVFVSAATVTSTSDSNDAIEVHGGDITNGANTNAAGDATRGYGGDTSGTGAGGIGANFLGGANTGTGVGGDGGYFRGGDAENAAGGYGVYAKGGSATATTGQANYGGYFVGGDPYSGSNDAGVLGIKTTGGIGEGVGAGGTGLEAYGGAGGTNGVGGVGAKFYGAVSNGNASGGLGASIQGGAASGTRNGGQGLLVNAQTIATGTGEPGRGAYIGGGSILDSGNSNDGGIGLEAKGGNVSTGGGVGGLGLKSTGGNTANGDGGGSIYAVGGEADGGVHTGGVGVDGLGGLGYYGGIGVRGTGASADEDDHDGGNGGYFAGGAGQAAGDGGDGITVLGGLGGASGESGVGARIAGVATAGRRAANMRLITIGGDPTVLTNGDIWFNGTA
jgi:hypothetical protein